MSDDKRADLHDVEPLRPVEDLTPDPETLKDVDRIGRAAAEVSGSTPAVGVTLETEREPAPPEEDDLDKLRRG